MENNNGGLFTIRNLFILVIVSFFLLFMKECTTSSKNIENYNDMLTRITALEVELNTISSKIDSSDAILKIYMDKSFENSMMKFVIYENDIDHGKMSIGDLRIKIAEFSKELEKYNVE